MMNSSNHAPTEEFVSRREFLSLRILPAKLKPEEAAWLLGFRPHAIPVLVRAGLLKPLGRAAPNCVKSFATVEIEQLRGDVKWLHKANTTVSEYWQQKNASKSVNGNHVSPYRRRVKEAAQAQS